MSNFREREFRQGDHLARRIPIPAIGINNCQYADSYRAVCDCGAQGGPYLWSAGADKWIRAHLARAQERSTPPWPTS